MQGLNKVKAYITDQFGNYLIGFSLVWLFMSAGIICFKPDTALLLGIELNIFGPAIAKIVAMIGIVTFIWGLYYKIQIFEVQRKIEFEEAREDYRQALMGLQTKSDNIALGNSID